MANLSAQEGALLIGFRGMDESSRNVIVRYCLWQAEREKATRNAERLERQPRLRLVAANGKRRK